MGFSVSIYVFRGLSSQYVWSELQLAPTGAPEEFPESPICGASIRNGDCILYVNDRHQIGEDVVKTLLPRVEVLYCNINETVMYSATALVVRGRERWCVVHDSNLGTDHLETTGPLPLVYENIMATKLAQQQTEANVDHVFDVPVEVFVAEGGMKYCENLDVDSPTPWQPLIQVCAKGRWWWPW